jgi:magnesium chelatase family protein
MVVRVATVAFEGIEARPVDVQVQIANGNVVFTVVGLGDKAVAESRESVRAALCVRPRYARHRRHRQSRALL